MLNNIQDIETTILLTNMGSIFLRIAAIWITLKYVIPLQIKEINVKNGLRSLRKQMLLIGISLTFLNILSIIFIIFRLFLDRENYMLLSGGLSIVNGIGFLFMAYILYKIYHQQYTPEQKEHHDKVEKLEIKEQKRLDNEVQK